MSYTLALWTVTSLLFKLSLSLYRPYEPIPLLSNRITVTVRKRVSLSNATAESMRMHRCGTVTSRNITRSSQTKNWFSRQFAYLQRHATVPLNKFLYWEFSKLIHYGILITTLIPTEIEEGVFRRVYPNMNK